MPRPDSFYIFHPSLDKRWQLEKPSFILMLIKRRLTVKKLIFKKLKKSFWQKETAFNKISFFRP